MDTYAGTILIVDDDPLDRALLSAGLSKAGYQVQVAAGGRQALEILAQPFDLILLDIMMPEMDGYQICRYLKADEHTRDIPVLLISALDATEDKVRAFEAGGVDYITKPFQFQEVLARVRTHLTLRNLQRKLQEANAELTRQLEELERFNAELQMRNQELDAFSHTVAHDLKNPLSLIMGYAELLAVDMGTLPPAALQESVQYIVQGAHKMYNIIESLLLLAGLRKAETKMEPLEMASILSEVQKRLRDMVVKYRAEIVQPDSWPCAMGYAPWVEEVWTNYVSNAIKYGGRPPHIELGFSVIAAREAGGENRPSEIRFWVRDNGQGLTPEEQSRLFVPFERLGQVRVEGHGLGLSIVRRIIEKMGGQVGSKSMVGQGSTFWFTLPTASA